ncbi:sporulation integral membrane protein YlbJ [Metabacillus iocasae]|uniref:Sporulation integral membrane protein YlbJ n=1 Tax=Priestia iocasae TaxID=2291674 RepID=A0ABS2QQN2_9BACI|nr:sporulation integral membrane protein YlbJ [Metabacillus iocasae]MBM7701751.1 sporulation integral membrane protein YlbJ [Metabacillus iocasae]
MSKSVVKTFILALAATALALTLMIYPKEALEASTRGLSMWWTVVFPSLLPFFIISEMLIGFGIVRFIGVLLEPLMRPLFRVPGSGAFVLAMGMASGFPAGAKLTADLRVKKHLKRIEAERLVSFTNSSNPIFIFGAIAVGFFNMPQIGIILALAHYLGNICVGLVMRFHGSASSESTEEQTVQKASLRYAFQEMHHTRLKDNRPIGKLLGDAVTSSIQTLLMIGGFIILFSVLNKLLYLMNISLIFSHFVSYLFALVQVTKELSLPFISGLFEITLGSQLTSQTNEASLLHQVLIVSFILAFSGFSVQAQVASILAETDIRFYPFFIARILHGFFSVIIALLIWNPLSHYLKTSHYNSEVAPVFSSYTSYEWVNDYLFFCFRYGPIVTIVSICIYIYIRHSRWHAL